MKEGGSGSADAKGSTADSVKLMQTLARAIGVHVEPNGQDVHPTPTTVKLAS
ncbi:MAG: hypothetical protein IPM79_02345 [Polyangiaceae bacterium]|nr:hypothetical protein [Polyangiaceae bacterium]